MVKCGVTSHRIAKTRKISINKSQSPTNVRNIVFKTINDGHIAFRMHVNKKDTKGGLIAVDWISQNTNLVERGRKRWEWS